MTMQRLDTLQILRALAAILVVVCHAVSRAALWSEQPDILVETAIHLGKLGVYVFFVISGFIMMRTSLDVFGHGGAASEFLKRRMIRIVPLYWLATLIEYAARSINHAAPAHQDLLASLLFVPQAVAPGAGASMKPILTVGWTLNYEMMFYAIFAACLLFKRRTGIMMLIGVLAGLVLAGSLLKPLSDTREPITLLTFWSDPIILLFGGGALLGLASRSALIRALPNGLSWSIAVLLCAIATFVVCVATYPVPLVWQVVFFTLSVASVALAAAATPETPGSGNLLSTAMVRLGDASYSIYLFHFFVLIGFEKLWWKVAGHGLGALYIVLASAAAKAAGYAVYLLVEKPLLRGVRLGLEKAHAAIQRPSQTRAAAVRSDPLQAHSSSSPSLLPLFLRRT